MFKFSPRATITSQIKITKFFFNKEEDRYFFARAFSFFKDYNFNVIQYLTFFIFMCVYVLDFRENIYFYNNVILIKVRPLQMYVYISTIIINIPSFEIFLLNILMYFDKIIMSNCSI